MQFPVELQDAIETVANNPKVAGTVSVATAAGGAAWLTDLIQSTVSMVAILTGVIATVFLIRVHWMTYKNRSLENKILRKQASDLGIDLSNEYPEAQNEAHR